MAPHAAPIVQPAPDEQVEAITRWQALVAAGLIGRPLAPDVQVAAIRDANEAILLAPRRRTAR